MWRVISPFSVNVARIFAITSSTLEIPSQAALFTLLLFYHFTFLRRKRFLPFFSLPFHAGELFTLLPFYFFTFQWSYLSHDRASAWQPSSITATHGSKVFYSIVKRELMLSLVVVNEEVNTLVASKVSISLLVREMVMTGKPANTIKNISYLVRFHNFNLFVRISVRSSATRSYRLHSDNRDLCPYRAA